MQTTKASNYTETCNNQYLPTCQSYNNVYTENYSTVENSLVVISKKEEFENDKFRIKKKFNFPVFKRQNPNAFSQPTIPTKYSIQSSYKNIPKSLNNSNRNILQKKATQIEEGEELECPEELSMCNISPSQRSELSKGSDNRTEKESLDGVLRDIQKKSEIGMAISGQFEDEVTNHQGDDDDNNNNIEEDEYTKDITDAIFKNGEEILPRNSANSPHPQSGNNVSPSPRNSGNHSNAQSKIDITSFYLSKSSSRSNTVINPLFKYTSKFEISSRLINDEVTDGVQITFPDLNSQKKFRFINAIEECNNELEEMKNGKGFYQKLLDMSPKTFYRVLSFLFEDYSTLRNINMEIRKKIKNSLKTIYSPVVAQFNKEYSQVLEVVSVAFDTKNFIKNNLNSPTLIFEMIITSAVKKGNFDYKSFQISYSYKYSNNQKEPYTNIYSFDVRPKNNIITWFSSEIEEYKYSYRRFCYAQNVISFATGDKVQFFINLFSSGNEVLTESIKFNHIEIIEDIPKKFFEKRQSKSDIPFDKYRSNEIENIAHMWKNAFFFLETDKVNEAEKKPINFKAHQATLQSFVKIFEKLFTIDDIEYDISKFFYFKVKMRANKAGTIKKNRYLNTNLQVVPKKSFIINECRCLCLLNFNTYREEFQIREGDKIVFYITDL